MFERMQNSRNPWQGDAKKVLAVCSAGLLRSPTLAEILIKTYKFNARAVGVDAYQALIPLDQVHIQWADEIIFLGHPVMFTALRTFKNALQGKTCHLFEIPDNYSFRDPKLVRLLKKKCKSIFGSK